jgi:predicted nucleic acid-binding protein
MPSTPPLPRCDRRSTIQPRRTRHLTSPAGSPTLGLRRRLRQPKQTVRRRIRVVSFVTVGELRYGALRADWGEFRLRRLERSLADLELIQANDALVYRYTELRAQASRKGHGLAQKIHEADRWIAATASVSSAWKS